MLHHRLRILCAVLFLSTLAACTPAQVAAFRAATPAQQQAIIRALNAPSRDCHQAIDRHWPASSRATAHRVMRAESGNVAQAKNSRSSASGCFQMLQLHSGRFNKLGYTWADRFNPDANVRVAADLFREQGWRPWALTV